MYQSHQTLMNNGITVCSVKTDAFTIKHADLDTVKGLLNFNDSIGSWRVSNNEEIIFPTIPLVLKQNASIPIKPLSINNLEIPDEFDTEAIARKLIEHKKVLLLGTSPGVGKSHACRY